MMDLLPTVVGLVIGTGYALLFALAAAGRTKGAPTRLDAVAQGIWALFGLVLALRITNWTLVPNVLWMLPVAIAAAGAALLVLRWRALPALPETRGRRVLGIVHIALMGVVTAVLALL